MNDKINEIEENKESNYITAEIIISEYSVNSDIKIIDRKGSTLKIDDETKPNECFHKFTNPGKHKIQYFFKDGYIFLDGMFSGCSSLAKIDLSHFDSEDNSMNEFFCRCYSLKLIDLSNVNTKNIRHMDSMFYDCRSLTELDLSSFNTLWATDMNEMFSGCSS